MDQKVLFIADYLRGGLTFSELCAMYTISRKTGYKWLNRYMDQGFDGLRERSRRPANSPHRVPYAIRKAVIDLRKEKRRSVTPLGPKKIQALLGERHPTWEVPSETAIHNILKSEGLVSARKRRRRVFPGQQPFSPVRHANDLWTTDFKGEFRTGDGCWCYPLTVMDHESRFLLGCQVFDGSRYAETKEAFTRLFREYGMPWRIRSDNGTPFASIAAGGLSRLSKWWIRLGIMPERIEPGKPQQNGRHERMHKTLKEDTAIPPAASAARQQGLFDSFRQEYNYERPHESLGQKTPGSQYQPSVRSMPEKLPELDYPGHFKEALVHSNGVIQHQGHRVYISGLLKAEKLGLEEVADGIWEAYYGPLKLGRFNMRQAKKSRNDYLKLNV
jgi:transposase InsO family protein